MTALLLISLTLLMGLPVQGTCIGLSIEVDGTKVDKGRVEFWEAGEMLPSQECQNGFSVPTGSIKDGALIVVVTPNGRFDYGYVSAEQMGAYVGALAWRVKLDTPPFEPGHWFLNAPRDATAILSVAIDPREGDGIVHSVYESARTQEGTSPASWRELLLRVDLLDASALVCVPFADDWTLDSSVKIIRADEPREGGPCGAKRPVPGEFIRDVSSDVLEDSARADVQQLFGAVVRAIRSR